MWYVSLCICMCLWVYDYICVFAKGGMEVYSNTWKASTGTLMHKCNVSHFLSIVWKMCYNNDIWYNQKINERGFTNINSVAHSSCSDIYF